MTETKKPPSSLDWSVTGKGSSNKLKIRIPKHDRLHSPKPQVEINFNNTYIIFRLTAIRARTFAQWLEKYAQWAESIPNQGGR